jgi:hypothetical protein
MQQSYRKSDECVSFQKKSVARRLRTIHKKPYNTTFQHTLMTYSEKNSMACVGIIVKGNKIDLEMIYLRIYILLRN